VEHIAVLGQVRYIFSLEALTSQELTVLHQLKNRYMRLAPDSSRPGKDRILNILATQRIFEHSLNVGAIF
jgi:hypothetical protein